MRFTQHEQEVWRLSAEGSAIAEGGSHEAKVFEAIAKKMDGLTIAELTVLSLEVSADLVCCWK